MNIIGGLVFCAGIIGALPVLGGFLEKAGKFLGGFQVIIGIIMMVLGLLGIFSLQGIVVFLVGVILLTGAFHVIPGLGKYLEKFGRGWAASRRSSVSSRSSSVSWGFSEASVQG
ncbi:MAG: rane protein HdeD [Methanoculleus sp.]|nr:rane protein HdeD [Methanoculleus sp.]MDK2988529.1 rane protein HdeD [Methanoculleus sp.]